MGYIYTGFTHKNPYHHQFKIGMTETDDTPISRIYAGGLIESGCLKVPNADKTTMLLLESVARFTARHICGLALTNGKMDWFEYEHKGKAVYSKEVMNYADTILNALAEECEMRQIPYEIEAQGYTMQGKVFRLVCEQYL
jgi:hypothetical protein